MTGMLASFEIGRMVIGYAGLVLLKILPVPWKNHFSCHLEHFSINRKVWNHCLVCKCFMMILFWMYFVHDLLEHRTFIIYSTSVGLHCIIPVSCVGQCIMRIYSCTLLCLDSDKSLQWRPENFTVGKVTGRFFNWDMFFWLTWHRNKLVLWELGCLKSSNGFNFLADFLTEMLFSLNLAQE